MSTFYSRAPSRVDLAGATLDLWPLNQCFPEVCTVNVGISIYAEAKLELSHDQKFHIESLDQKKHLSLTWEDLSQDKQLPLISLLLNELWDKKLPPLKITTNAKSPKGAGLGGSSSLAIATVGGLTKYREHLGDPRPLSEHDMARVVANAEARIIRIPTGIQDQWGALRGRANVIQFSLLEENVETFEATHWNTLNDSMVICYSGESRDSAINNWQIYRNVFDGDQRTLELFSKIATLGHQAAHAMRQGDWQRLHEISSQEWNFRTQLFGLIETPRTQAIKEAAMKAGATLCRVCGAGGGGALALFGPPEKRASIIAAAEKQGGACLDATIADRGLTIE